MLKELLLIRHGESAGNVARDAALAHGLPVIDIAQRDADVPLSARGEEQARALGGWLEREKRIPNIVLSSPFVRARETGDIMASVWNNGTVVRVDERLREKEFGMLDRLTRRGIEQRFPEQAEMRKRLGKFYYRPPSGESWADVILRLRSAFDWIVRDCSGRVAIVSHQVVVLCLRYIIEDLDERALLAIDRQGEVANCSVTTYVRDERAPHGLRLLQYNAVEPLQEEGAEVTHEPDAHVTK